MVEVIGLEATPPCLQSRALEFHTQIHTPKSQLCNISTGPDVKLLNGFGHSETQRLLAERRAIGNVKGDRKEQTCRPDISLLPSNSRLPELSNHPSVLGEGCFS